MPPILHSLPSGLLAYAGPLLAVVVALAGAVLCRAKSRRAALPAVGALAALLGWAVVAHPTGFGRTAIRSGPGLLLVPGAAALVLAVVAAWAGGRLRRWGPVLAVVIAGWWLADATAGRAEFWRVWFAVGALGWLLSRASAEEPGRGLAGAAALWGGLALTGAPAGWTAAALVGAAAWAGLAAAGAGAFVPAAAMAALVAGSDLALGRIRRGGLNAADLACIAAVLAPLLAGVLAPRMRRLGAAGPVLAGLGAAATAAGAVWVVHRATRM